MIDDEFTLWGDRLLPILLNVIGDSTLDVETVEMHFEYGMFATFTLKSPRFEDQVYVSEIFGTSDISPLLDLPKGVQAITIVIGKGSFTLVDTRFAPIGIDIDAFLNKLRQSEFHYQNEVMA